MQFNTPSLNEVIDEVFLLFDGRPILENYTTLNIKLYNKKENEIDLSTVDEITGSQNIDKNAQSFDIYMENSVSENNVNKQARIYPSTNGWASVRSSETELTTNNFLMQVGEEIERVLKFEIYADVKIDYYQANGSSVSHKVFDGEMQVDMTDWLFTQRARNGLDYNLDAVDTPGTDTTYWMGKYLNNSLYFSGNQILGWQDGVDIFTLFGSVKLWQLFLATAAFEGGYLTVDSGYWIESIQLTYDVSTPLRDKPRFATDVRDFMFRLKYVPKETVRVQLERDKNVGYGTLRANQSARIVDTELLGNNMQSKLNRDGEKELLFTRLNNPFNINDYYLNYYGTRLDETHYANGDVLSTLTLSRNYAKKSERIDLPNRPRQTQISEQNTIRNDIITEYCEVALSDSTANDSSIGSTGINRFLKTFDDTVSSDNPVEFITWDGNIMLECTSQGIGKTMSFKFEFEDNITAGVKTTDLDGSIYGNEFVSYTDADGTKEYCRVRLYGNFNVLLPSLTTYAYVAQELPSYSPTFVELVDEHFDLQIRRILKDSGEVYALSYQMIIVSDDDVIFVGNKMAQENGLVVKTAEDLYMYSQSTPIQLGQVLDISSMTKQKIVTGTPIDTSEVKIASSTTTGGGKITFSTNFNNFKYYAVCNEDGEVYVIVNKISRPNIYFNFKENRSD